MNAGGPENPDGDRALRGVYFAIVTQNDDLDGPGGRVKLSFPWLPEEDQSSWAPLAVPMAGDAFGTYWVPEVGDAVLVVFLGGDVRGPVVIGGCFSEEDPPPETNAGGGNDFRLLKSRSGHRLIFDDSSKTKVVLTDRTDGNVAACGAHGKGGSSDKNAVEVPAPGGSAGVAVSSTSGTVNLVCPSGTLKVSARKVEVVASGSMDVSGSQSVTLESPARATIGGGAGTNFAGQPTKVGP